MGNVSSGCSFPHQEGSAVVLGEGASRKASAGKELLIHVVEGGAKLRLFSPTHDTFLHLLATSTSSMNNNNPSSMNRSEEPPPHQAQDFDAALHRIHLESQEVQTVTVKGQLAHLLIQMPDDTAANKFLSDLATLPRLGHIAFHLPVRIPDQQRFFERIHPHLQPLSIRDVTVRHNSVTLINNSNLEIQIYDSYGVAIQEEEEDDVPTAGGNNTVQYAVQPFLDPLVKHVLRVPTVQSLSLMNGFSGPQTFEALVRDENPEIRSHLRALTLKQWDEPLGEFEMHYLIQELTSSPPPLRRKRKRERDDDDNHQYSSITTTKDAPPLPLQLEKLAFEDIKLRQPDFERLVNTVKINTSLREFHMISCLIIQTETLTKVEDVIGVDSAVFDILKHNSSLKKLSFRQMRIEFHFTWGTAIGEVAMVNNDYSKICGILEENNHHTIESIDLGTSEEEEEEDGEIPEKYWQALALNIFGFRKFMGIKSEDQIEKDEFCETLIRAKVVPLNMKQQDQRLVPCLFQMFRSNPLLVEYLSSSAALTTSIEEPQQAPCSSSKAS